MEKPFADELARQVSSHMSVTHPAFVRRKPSREGNADWLIYEWKPSAGFQAAVGIRFVKWRDYVISAVMWSRNGEISLDEVKCVSKGREREPGTEFAKYTKVTLSANDFGRLENYYAMRITEPDKAYLEKKFSSPSAKRKLSEAHIYDWRNDPSIGDWGMLVEVLGEEAFNKEDVEYGLGDLPQQLIELIDNHFIPYLHKVWESRT